jgi:hypothetical protein
MRDDQYEGPVETRTDVGDIRRRECNCWYRLSSIWRVERPSCAGGNSLAAGQEFVCQAIPAYLPFMARRPQLFLPALLFSAYKSKLMYQLSSGLPPSLPPPTRARRFLPSISMATDIK